MLIHNVPVFNKSEVP